MVKNKIYDEKINMHAVHTNILLKKICLYFIIVISNNL